VNKLDTAQELLTSAMSPYTTTANFPFEKLVTLNGEVLHIDGWLSGGSSKDGSQQGLLAYERELRELPQQLHKHLELIEQLNSRISEVERSQEMRRIEQG